MVDRTDIDALLIGSLYGELSSADEARLKAHLESHPADRTAFEGLARTRDAVRSSRIFAHQAEPSQSISALLLQEAARRAPRKAREDGEREGWFARLRRSFLMSPAFAAAAMLVVVVGVAGTLYLRQGDQFARPEVSLSAEHAEDRAAGSAAGAPVAATPSAAPDPAAAAPEQAQAADAVRARLADADGSYRVGLTEAKDGRRDEEQAKPKADRAPAPAPRPAKKEAATAEKTKLARQAGPSSLLEVSTPQRAPKELDDARPKKPAAKGRAPEREYAKAAVDAPATEPAATARAPGAAAPAPAAPAMAQDFSKAPAAPTGGAVGGAGAAARAGGGELDPDVAWAKEQHSRLITQVKAGQCGDAAGTAVALSSRAPGYYQQNVENDRAVKSCLAYINAERERATERAQRARATTRRLSDEDAAASKKKAAAPRKAAPADAAPAKTDAATTTKSQ